MLLILTVEPKDGAPVQGSAMGLCPIVDPIYVHPQPHKLGEFH